MIAPDELASILKRLSELEAHNAIRNCLNRYMEICDGLNANSDLDELMALFDQECIWEGIGEKYAKSFGRYESWSAIYAMFKTYTQQESHFVLNAHFVNSEQIAIEDDEALGSWLLLQSASFRHGQSHLNAAKLRISFKRQADQSWKIKHFQTENIFSRAIDTWNSAAELPVPQAAQFAQHEDNNSLKE